MKGENVIERFFAIGLIISLLLFASCSSDKASNSDSISTTTPTEKKDTIVHIEIPDSIYGFPKDSFVVHENEIHSNQFLADILLKHHISYPEIDSLVRASKDVFDVRKLRAGRKYTILCTKDSLQKAECFIYEINPIEYVVYDMRQGFDAHLHKKPVEVVEKSASGIINSSLYLTMTENGLNPELVMELADIYAWTVDFYRIQKGDKFKVLYQEKFVDGQSVGIGHIRAAMFEHRGEEHYAIYFEQKGNGDYFDLNNQSQRKAFLKAPLRYSRISSRFSGSRKHPVTGRRKAHKGTDYAAPTGTPIMTVGDGTIIAATYTKYNGNYVKVKHNSTYSTQYLHMSKIKRGIRKGVRVKQGDIIGFVGSTGLATGPHCCFRFWKHGKQVDPFRQKIPAAKPIVPANIGAYEKVRDRVKAELDEIPWPTPAEPSTI